MNRFALSATAVLCCLLAGICAEPHDASSAQRERRDLGDIFNRVFGIFRPKGPDQGGSANGCKNPVRLELDKAGVNPEAEHLVSYFREDVGMNIHHWFWHNTYPFEGEMALVNKSRRGELFWYLHKQMLARYNSERLGAGLARVKPLDGLFKPLLEGYTPNMDTRFTGGAVWPPRAPNSVLKDFKREEVEHFTVKEMDEWRQKIEDAIDADRMVNVDGDSVALDEVSGIDILTNAIESNPLSPDQEFYGHLHNYGHVVISAVHDPDGSKGEILSVMFNNSISLRDPSFYRWHGWLEIIFQRHKMRLKSYTKEELSFDGVRLTGLEVQTPGLPKNRLSTFLQESDIDLRHGINFNTSGPSCARYTHLQHRAFSYRLEVKNEGRARPGTVRLFLAPRTAEGDKVLPLLEQRGLFLELDKFNVQLKRGSNVIERKSKDSSVTNPFERTFNKLRNYEVSGDELEQYYYCTCGWPQHMLIPRGNSTGMAFELFAMISDDVQAEVGLSARRSCIEAVSYCGAKDMDYPDSRAMDFPLDRKPRDGAETLAKFLTPNMAVQVVTIQYKDVVLPPGPKNGATE